MPIQTQEPDPSSLRKEGYALVIAGPDLGRYVFITELARICACSFIDDKQEQSIPLGYLAATPCLPCAGCRELWAISALTACEKCGRLHGRECLQRCLENETEFFLCDQCLGSIDQSNYDRIQQFSLDLRRQSIQARGDAWAMQYLARRLEEELAEKPIEQASAFLPRLFDELQEKAQDAILKPEQRQGLLNTAAKLTLIKLG